ncbi:MAG: hypothetical protein QXX08_02590 [Candidatus Bathyarchaeia archaeon]
MAPRNRTVPKSLVVAYVSIFAALNVLSDFIPLTPILGIPGTSLSLSWIMSPLTGILLGAEMGGISCLISGLIGILLGQPPIFGAFTPLRPAVSAFITGLLISKRWHIAATILSTFVVGWLILPAGRDASIILIFHLIGLTIILLFRGKIGDLAKSKMPKKTALGLFLATYCGNISRHLLGNILGVTISNLAYVYFILALPYTFVEQLIFAAGAMLIGVSLNHLKIHETLHLS